MTRRTMGIWMLGILASARCAAADPEAASTTAPPATTATPPAIADSWSILCTKGDCTMIDQIVDQDHQVVMARLQVRRDEGADILVLTVPFNVLLDPGAALDLGAAHPQVYPYAFCGLQGCVVRIPFTDGMASTFEHAPWTRILVASLDGKIAAIPFSMNGFDEARRTYEREETAGTAPVPKARRKKGGASPPVPPGH